MSRQWPMIVTASALLTLGCKERRHSPDGATESSSAGDSSASSSQLAQPAYDWPLDGSAGRDWIITNYLDRQPGAGLLDYRGGQRTYDGHGGVDIAIPSLRVMDTGVVVRAVAAGQVTAVHDGEPDRNTLSQLLGCKLVANSVYVTQADGREAR
ncbi:MAG TPA: hypothetical protein VLC09_13880, partial [Polyangiaceae bacterium]|nr:hypothetical protein [Polyangiaceae bacterium]